MTLFHQIYSHLSLALILVWMSFVDSVSASRCSCYTFDGKSLRLWSQGQTLCRDNNEDLVSMETIAEWEFIKTQIQNKSTFDDKNEWWIGLVRRDGKWTWLSNHSLTYDKWDRGKPISDPDKTSVRMIKEYPKGTYGHFNNIRKNIQRSGTICEYHEKECTNNPSRVKWCPPTTTTPSRSTMMTTWSTINVTSLNQTPSTRITEATGIGYSQTSTNTIMPTTSNSKVTDAQQPFPTTIVACILGVLVLLCVCLLIFVCTWNRRKQERKPRRNSHLDKKSRVPVKLEHSPTTNTNNLIDSTTVMHMTELTNSCSNSAVVNDNAVEPAYASIDRQETSFNSTDIQPAPLYASLDKQNITKQSQMSNFTNVSPETYDPKKTVNQQGYHADHQTGKGNTNKDRKYPQEHEETPPDVCPSTCVYATVDKSSKTDVKDNRLVYAQLAEFKNEQKDTAKKPPLYQPTEYATILTPIKLTKSKENISQV